VEIARPPNLYRGTDMIDTRLSRSALRVRHFFFGLLLLLPVSLSSISTGETGTGTPSVPVPTGASRVEEDWEIVIKEPSTATDSPQLSVVFGPADPESKTHAVFELNHATQPSYLKGGMQLQCWWGEELVDYRNQHHPSDLHVNNETITFTTATQTGNNKILMEVLNGNSTSFGAFGGETSLRAQVNLAKADLSDFDSNYSLQHSGCGWGKNRVSKFTRKAIRYYDKDGSLAAQDTTERVIHQLEP
jgi:hypothetical protein